jgi:bifunctional pyridoxal-dependent enzyme with beta-cystathionase and maltose regulon repressor activities
MHDLGALLAKAHETHAKLVYLVNPDNPSGTFHPQASLEAFVEALPKGTLLLLDEAYLETAPVETIPAVAPDDLRVLRLRTFSKGYGMAGARIGYAVGAAEIVSAFDKVRKPRRGRRRKRGTIQHTQWCTLSYGVACCMVTAAFIGKVRNHFGLGRVSQAGVAIGQYVIK